MGGCKLQLSNIKQVVTFVGWQYKRPRVVACGREFFSSHLWADGHTIESVVEGAGGGVGEVEGQGGGVGGEDGIPVDEVGGGLDDVVGALAAVDGQVEVAGTEVGG